MAAQVYDWTFTNVANGIEAYGTLTTGAAANGGYDVTALTGFVNDPTIGVDAAITGYSSAPGIDGSFAWDNIVYTTPGAAHLDNLGLLFDAGGQEVNIYNSIGPCCSAIYTPGSYPKGDITAGSNNNTGGDAGTFNISAAPEPATWAMMFMGIGMIGGALRYGRQKRSLSFA
jgi:hypothetical protein